MQNKKYFCYEIFKNLAIWTNFGQISYNPCSIYNGFIKSTDRFDLRSIWYATEHQQLVDSIKNDIPIEGCSACYTAEEHGLVSRRQGSRELYEVYFKDTNLNLSGPQSIDYSVGNLCNLKCVICGPSNSSAWIPDYQKIYPLVDVSQYKYDKFNQIDVDSPELLKNIINVHFHGGGEPLLSSNHINLLKKIKEVKGLADVHVFYNTNGTILPSNEVLELWSECQLVELYFSIDDVGSRFEYQRTGASWDKVVENLKWFKENMPVNHMFNINCVWSYLNLYYLTDLVDWYNVEFSTNRLGDPINLIFQKAIGPFAINGASNHVLNVLTNKFKNYSTLLELIKAIPVDNTNTHSKFWNSIQKIDSVRGTNFIENTVEWAKLLN
jgi:hypothetical protein